MTASQSAGVNDWEGGKSGIARKPAPQWWTPQIDRKLLRSLLKRKNYRGFINGGRCRAVFFASKGAG
jgi:hypothetical protein